ncbi:glycosyltransferase family 1 protein [Uliginosibacterium sp. H3]|uniref:Glycosyltransferase family 1 protein n=1 Tax=Uliginosibacterium silvisoli TaxID=3114758 RepID=A0ABU6K8X6_9RHOO|nr:glycosyltransferase family 1 protein [Uliginosibacterium sp. H3]
MKVAYITETWPPALNGAALAAARVVSHLRKRGHGVELIRPRLHMEDAGDTDTVTVPTMSVPMCADLRIGMPVGQHLIKRWRAARPDVVHVATQGPLGWSACNAARALDIPVTSDFRDRFDAPGGKVVAPLLRAYLRGFHNRTACTFVPTDEVAGQLSEQGFRNLVVSGRGVDTVAFSPYYRSESLRRHWDAIGPVVLYVGRLSEEKNLSALLDAYAAIRVAEPSARLVLVGEGPMRDVFEERCPDAIFTGHLSGSMLSACYASADMLLLPALAEGFGNVTLEAMASGLPVVAYDMGAAAMHIRNDVNGITVVPGDQYAFVRAAVALACDEPLRERLGAAACQTARAASWEHILMDFEQTLYANCASQSTASIGACPA